MATSVVGTLRVLLTMNAAEFERGMKRVTGAADRLSKDLGGVGKQATALGSSMTRSLTLPLVALGAGALKAASDFESSFAGVKKTLTITHGVAEEVFAGMAQGLRDMAKEIPVSVNELNRIAEAAGQLGVGQDDVLKFTKTMAMLGVTTNVTADEAATAIASIQNIFGGGREDTDRFASALVALGNAGASTEKNILDMSQRIAKAGSQVGLTQGQVMAFASSLSGIGIEAEAGGSAMQRVFLKISDAVMAGGKDLDEFARVAGTSSEAFATAFRTNAADATVDFIAGLKRIKDEGGNTNAVIEGLMGKNIILKSTLMGASGAVNDFRTNLKIQADAWRENTALTKEAEIRFGTVKNQLVLLTNKAYDVAITLGQALMPAMTDLMTAMTPVVAGVGKLVEGFGKLPQPVRVAAAGFIGLVAALGPVMWAFGTLTTTIATIIAAFGKKGLATRLLTTDLKLLGLAGVGATPVLLALATAIAAVAAARERLSASGGKVVSVIDKLTEAEMAEYRVQQRLGQGWEYLAAKAAALEKATGSATGAMGEAGEVAQTFKDDAAKLANDVAVLGQVLADMTAKGEATPGMLARIKTEAQLLAARGAELTPELRALGEVSGTTAKTAGELSDQLKALRTAVAALTPAQRASIAEGRELGLSNKEIATIIESTEEVVKAYTTTTKGAAKATDEFAESLKKIGGADAIAGAKEVQKQLAAVGGPLKVLPSQLEEMAARMREGAQAALMLGQAGLAAEYERIAKTLDPLVQFQARFNVKIGEYVTQAGMAESATGAVNDQLAEMLGTVRSLTPLVSSMTDAMKGLGGAARDTNITFPPFKPSVESSTEAEAKAGKIGKDFGAILGENMLQALERIPDMIVDLIVHDGDWRKGAVAIASMLGRALGESIGEFFGGRLGKALGGAIGSLAGPVLDKVIGLFTGPSAEADIARRVEQSYGVAISEGLTKAIALAAKKVGRQAAELLSLDKIIGEAGGLNAGNLDTMTGKLRDVFVLLQRGSLTAAQAVEILDKNWRAFAEAGTDATGALSEGLRETIRLARQFNVVSREMAAYIREQAVAAIDGANAAIGYLTKEFDHWQELTDEIEETKKAIDTLNETPLKGRGEEWAKDMADAKAKLADLLTSLHMAGTAVMGELETMGFVALGVYNAAIAAGMTHAQAMKAAGPGLEQLSLAYEQLSLEVEDAEVKALLLQATLQRNNPGLVAGVEGLTTAIIAMGNNSTLTAGTFARMQTSAMAMFTRIQGEMAAAGADMSTNLHALVPMQDFLRAAAKAAKELGVPLDANTQMLIDQSIELGLWKDDGEDAAETMQDVMSDVRDIVKEVKDAIIDMGRALRGLPPLTTVQVHTEYTSEGDSPFEDQRERTPIGDPNQQPWMEGQPFASGTKDAFGDWFARFSSRGTPALLHGKEAVVTPQQAVPFALDTLSGLIPEVGMPSLTPAFAGVSATSATTNTNNYVMVAIPMEAAGDAHRITEEVFRALPPAIRMNRADLRVNIERVIEDYTRTYGRGHS